MNVPPPGPAPKTPDWGGANCGRSDGTEQAGPPFLRKELIESTSPLEGNWEIGLQGKSRELPRGKFLMRVLEFYYKKNLISKGGKMKR